MYFFIQCTEDGMYVTRCDHAEAAAGHLEEIAGPDIDPEYRPNFVSVPPSYYSNERDVCIIKGEVVIPKAVTTVTEWSL